MVKAQITVTIQPAKTGGSGTITVGTTPTRIMEKTTSIKAVAIKADDDNTGNIYVGFSEEVSEANGFKLAKGQFIEININDLSKIYLVGSASNQKVHYIWVT